MERIDKFIEKQRKVEPSPFLEERILAKVESLKSAQSSPWYSVIALTATAAVVALALYVGSTLSLPGESSNGGLLVNDYYLEKLSIYDTNEIE